VQQLRREISSPTLEIDGMLEIGTCIEQVSL
jgi:hypothetical protein